MLNIYLNCNKSNIIELNDVYFNKYTYKLIDYNIAKRIIKEIDDVELTEDFMIVSKFTNGLLDLSKLSTGCKTVLNIVFNTDKIFNISECGVNALSIIYSKSIGNAYANYIVTPLRDISCDIKVVYKDSSYNFKEIDELRNWYSEVC